MSSTLIHILLFVVGFVLFVIYSLKWSEINSSLTNYNKEGYKTKGVLSIHEAERSYYEKFQFLAVVLMAGGAWPIMKLVLLKIIP